MTKTPNGQCDIEDFKKASRKLNRQLRKFDKSLLDFHEYCKRVMKCGHDQHQLDSFKGLERIHK